MGETLLQEEEVGGEEILLKHSVLYVYKIKYSCLRVSDLLLHEIYSVDMHAACKKKAWHYIM